MKLFINSGVCERKWNVKIRKGASKLQLCLTIPNYLEEKKKLEEIKFVFNIKGLRKESFNRNLILEDIYLEKIDNNSYVINPADKKSEKYMYALIRNASVVLDDVFIPRCMKDKVEVLRRIRFIDDEVDYGDFLSNVYLIRIKLECRESLPVYLTCSKPSVLREHYVFYRTDYNKEYCVSEKLKTFIYVKENQYISLSELCK